MRTKAQKNFKKQIEEWEKDNKDKAKPVIYSYIDKDIIDHSYRKKTNKNKTIKVSIIIGALFMACILYSWAKMGEVAEVTAYVEQVEQYDQKIYQLLNTTEKENWEGCKEKIINIVSSFVMLEYPKVAEQYYKTTLEKYETINEMLLYLQLQEIDKANVMVKEFNRMKKQQRQELLKMFNEVGIDYRIEKNTVRYRYKK